MSSSVSGLTNTTYEKPVADTKTETDRTKLNNDDFLKLFVTSLQYQDPMSPMENSEMMAQMAQMTQVEQTAKMADTVEKLKEVLTGSTLERGAGFLGKKVTATDSDGNAEIGIVQTASINENGILELLVNNHEYQIGQLSQVSL